MISHHQLFKLILLIRQIPRDRSIPRALLRDGLHVWRVKDNKSHWSLLTIDRHFALKGEYNSGRGVCHTLCPVYVQLLNSIKLHIGQTLKQCVIPLRLDNCQSLTIACKKTTHRISNQSLFHRTKKWNHLPRMKSCTPFCSASQSEFIISIWYSYN